MSDLRTYLREKLTADGYGGLAGDGCGCQLMDLIACDSDPSLCRPGYCHDCTKCPRTDDDCPMEDGPTRAYCVTDSRDWPEPRRDDG